MTAYYNEFDRSAAAWLRELIAKGLIAPGEVDERSIEDVHPGDLRGFTQCHFFAGIGGWSLALRMAGWPDDRPVWTGSCPCQPFSAAGKGTGFSDERHLWPDFHWLIGQCEPPVIFGEQVASADGLVWLDRVQADLEATGYAFGAADLCAAGVGAPHIRQRLYWVADAVPAGLSERERSAILGAGRREKGRAVVQRGGAHLLSPCEFCGYEFDNDKLGRYGCPNCEGEGLGGMAYMHGTGRAPGCEGLAPMGHGPAAGADRGADAHGRTGPLHGFWRATDWLGCRDGKFRPVEPGTFPLAHGLPARVGRLRGYGNAIVPQVAEVFIRSVM